ncbi:parathymosin-like [Gossypium australe]|uniref:Parathymosin-like n=1 Tax=Gossypium australe TaxID=47621 RepID=A0A5B6VBC5_9ROSI|nr:parathymosin-like [Gossypium australe]
MKLGSDSCRWYKDALTMKPQERANPNNRIVCGQRMDQIEGEMQSMRIEVKQEQVKAIVFCSGKVLSSPNNPTHEEDEKGANDLQDEILQNDDAGSEPEKVVKSTVESEVEQSVEPIPIKVPFHSRLEGKRKRDDAEFDEKISSESETRGAWWSSMTDARSIQIKNR